MCNATVITFGALSLGREEIEGRRILDVGSLDVNGSLRYIIESCKPKEYVGVDMIKGKGVDVVCDAKDLVKEFGREKFDVVIATELLEHVKDWQSAISNIKNVCKPNGIMLVTTKMPKFPFHAYPDDYWRFTAQDFRSIFSDCRIERLDAYPNLNICLKAVKPNGFKEADLSGYRLYRMALKSKIKFVIKQFIKKCCGG